MFHVKHPALRHLTQDLAELERASLLRRRPKPLDPGALTFCSNDYLGLAQATSEIHGHPGAGASRLIAGERAEHETLERYLASWLGYEGALAFSSGYAANVGLLSALAQRGDLIVSDERNHASIIDGCRLSRADVEVIPHLDVAATAHALAGHPQGRRWVVTEGYFSMDADSPDLRALRAVCDAQDAALLVDEAHSLGVLGPGGQGICAEQGIVPDALVGTFGKAFGASGAFIAGPTLLLEWLWNRARSFVFSTGLSPLVAQCALQGIQVAERRPGLRERTLAAAAGLRAALDAAGIPAVGYGHILPVVLGAPAAALELSAALAQHGVIVQAIRPPTVPRGTSRLRITASALHGEADVDRAARAFLAVQRG